MKYEFNKSLQLGFVYLFSCLRVERYNKYLIILNKLKGKGFCELMLLQQYKNLWLALKLTFNLDEIVIFNVINFTLILDLIYSFHIITIKTQQISKENQQNYKRNNLIIVYQTIPLNFSVMQHENYQARVYSQMQAIQRLQISNKNQDNPNHGRLPLIRQIRQNGFNNLDQLKIKMKRGVKYHNLIQFKYLIFASFKHPACRNARGIILDQNQNFKVVALPYFKFFDFDDSKYSQFKNFNFKNYKIYQKHDGSLASVYFYQNEWHVASSGVPDGQAPYYFCSNQEQKYKKVVFRQQFWRVFNELGFKLPLNQDRNKTFIFELMSKSVTIVVKRNQSNLVLHGVRNIDTLQQQDPNPYGSKYNWKVSQPFDFQIKNPQNPISQILAITQKLDPRKQEGFILCDNKYLRLKVKNNNYKRLHWLKQIKQVTASKKQQIELYLLQNVILPGQTQTFTVYCSEWAVHVQQILNKLQKMNKYVLKIYEQIKNLPKKQFALQVQKKDKRLVSFFFALQKNYNQFNGKVQTAVSSAKVYDIIKNMNFDQLDNGVLQKQ